MRIRLLLCFLSAVSIAPLQAIPGDRASEDREKTTQNLNGACRRDQSQRRNFSNDSASIPRNDNSGVGETTEPPTNTPFATELEWQRAKIRPAQKFLETGNQRDPSRPINWTRLSQLAKSVRSWSEAITNPSTFSVMQRSWRLQQTRHSQSEVEEAKKIQVEALFLEAALPAYKATAAVQEAYQLNKESRSEESPVSAEKREWCFLTKPSPDLYQLQKMEESAAAWEKAHRDFLGGLPGDLRTTIEGITRSVDSESRWNNDQVTRTAIQKLRVIAYMRGTSRWSLEIYKVQQDLERVLQSYQAGDNQENYTAIENAINELNRLQKKVIVKEQVPEQFLSEWKNGLIRLDYIIAAYEAQLASIQFDHTAAVYEMRKESGLMPLFHQLKRSQEDAIKKWHAATKSKREALPPEIQKLLQREPMIEPTDGIVALAKPSPVEDAVRVDSESLTLEREAARKRILEFQEEIERIANRWEKLVSDHSLKSQREEEKKKRTLPECVDWEDLLEIASSSSGYKNGVQLEYEERLIELAEVFTKAYQHGDEEHSDWTRVEQLIDGLIPEEIDEHWRNVHSPDRRISQETQTEQLEQLFLTLTLPAIRKASVAAAWRQPNYFKREDIAKKAEEEKSCWEEAQAGFEKDCEDAKLNEGSQVDQTPDDSIYYDPNTPYARYAQKLAYYVKRCDLEGALDVQHREIVERLVNPERKPKKSSEETASSLEITGPSQQNIEKFHEILREIKAKQSLLRLEVETDKWKQFEQEVAKRVLEDLVQVSKIKLWQNRNRTMAINKAAVKIQEQAERAPVSVGLHAWKENLENEYERALQAWRERMEQLTLFQAGLTAEKAKLTSLTILTQIERDIEIELKTARQAIEHWTDQQRQLPFRRIGSHLKYAEHLYEIAHQQDRVEEQLKRIGNPALARYNKEKYLGLAGEQCQSAMRILADLKADTTRILDEAWEQLIQELLKKYGDYHLFLNRKKYERATQEILKNIDEKVTEDETGDD